MKKFLKSLSFATKGIALATKQSNFKIQLLVASLTVFLGVFFQITASEWCMVLLCIGLVLSMETINTALEYLVDFVSPEFHKTAGAIKDIAAGAVLISSIISVIIGAIVFYKYIIALLTTI